MLGDFDMTLTDKVTWPYITLTDKVLFYSFAKSVISFSFIDEFNSYLDKDFYDLTNILDDFDMTFLWPWLRIGSPIQ